MPWTSVFEHDQNGIRISGNKAALIRNVEQGVAVRIAYIVSAELEKNVYRRALFEANVIFSAFGEIHAQAAWNSVDFSTTHDYLTFPVPNATYILNLSTNGRINRRTVTAAGVTNDKLSRRALEWFCDL
jgi:hypothetical protein